MDSKAYAKEHKQAFIAKVVKGKVPVLEEKLAIFMAGTPGAGKTEVVESLMEFANDEELCVIDSDRFRAQFPGYNGSNSSDFQPGATYLVNTTFDYLLKEGYSFILDGTFGAHQDVVIRNVKRALKRDYHVILCFVYQEPLRAWLFTKSRTKLEGRKVPKEVFIRSYVQMIDNLSIVKETFNDAISYRVVDNSVGYVKGRMPRMVDDLLDVVPRFYTRQELEDLLDD
ncbi:zeta toxin family protein [Streptococcus vestibularis]|uniref:UDP-N-acetylglucosamine kinase n=1 Tax=Streptococcus salivarius TaxID=1304 RepID=H2D740_STRSL|nr:putative zeta toxin [Streptococcus salivarius]